MMCIRYFVSLHYPISYFVISFTLLPEFVKFVTASISSLRIVQFYLPPSVSFLILALWSCVQLGPTPRVCPLSPFYLTVLHTFRLSIFYDHRHTCSVCNLILSFCFLCVRFYIMLYQAVF